MVLYVLCAILTLCISALGAAPNGPWDAFNLAPDSRTVYPRSVHGINGTVTDAHSLLSNGSATLAANGSFVTLDFGYEVGGWISLNFDNVSDSSSIALSFTESPVFIRPYASDDSSYPSANTTYDGVLEVPAPLTTGYWTQPIARLRGGYRYLTIVSTSHDPVTISNISCAISFMPHWDNMKNYSGYFYASVPDFFDEDFLTKIWYSGAYTVQTDTVPLNTGREVPFVSSPGWLNNATLGVAGPIIVDGAKRDRAVWPGDMGIAVPTQFVSTNDLLPTRNALSTMFAAQNAETGALPESGPPLSQQGSDTYHGWTLIGTYNYFLYSGDYEWMENVWSNYTKAVRYLAGKVNATTGLLDVTGTRDWGRLWQGGFNSEANAIYYKVCVNSAEIASYLNNSELSMEYATNASTLKTTFNDAYWWATEGMYRDNLTSTLCPQDANSLAVLFNLTESAEQAALISEGLERYWNEYGSIAPELPDTIAPFIGGFELQAHFASGNDRRAMDLLRREWGYMLYTNLSVQSTLLEGYTSNGSLYYRSTDGYNYDPAYTSHSHGWSTGPTSALTFYVLGLTVTSPQGRTWLVAPHTSGLSSVQGGFETPRGWFGVKWTTASTSFNLSVDSPEGTSGTVILPINGTTITVDGSIAQPSDGISLHLEGGNHTIFVQN
ncbi:glycoside hydrolase family 78 protein [Wolfiporia cocos MD-104 SS10]|uniref:Glycoside hydrolase family 78 protein n=1 Tax=Wolfiporia cocos (strain MD-104) TaxID=742152 RepID=A0A2H3JSS8_WOLCO|nr:glycoside hydrolase family 78 protein [Wolfiporia cocos MD-104 SS10]